MDVLHQNVIIIDKRIGGGLMLWTKCNSEIKVGKKFCGICGTPAVVPERRCGACNTKLDDGENFCSDCGTKYGEATAAKSQTPEKSQVVSSDSVCHITAKGNMAAIGDKIFFKYKDKIYSTSMSNGQKANVLLDKRNFMNIENEYNDYPIQQISKLNAWNGKLYFYVASDCYDGEEAIFGEYGSKGIFSYCPKTNKLELIDDLEGCRNAHVFANKAYASKMANYETTKIWRSSIAEKYGRYSAEYERIADVTPSIIVTIDLETKQKNEVFMPALEFRDWPDLNVEEEYKDTVVPSDWYTPAFNNGYLYTSSFGALNPIRFRANNPKHYEILASGLSPCFGRDESYYVKPLASCGDVVLMYNIATDSVDFFSNTTLQTINSYKSMAGLDWQTFGGNFFVISENYNAKMALVYKVDEAKMVGSVDGAYSRMNDAIYFNKTIYALGNLCLEDKDGEEIYDDLALYRIPWDKIFKADTKLDDLAQPLF